MAQNRSLQWTIKGRYFFISAAVIFACLMAGRQIQYWLDDAFPGAIIGMLLLFILLLTRVVPLKWVKPTGSLILQYMMVLFIPVCVGIMQYFEQLLAHALPIIASVIGVSFVVLVLMSLALEKWLTKREAG